MNDVLPDPKGDPTNKGSFTGVADTDKEILLCLDNEDLSNVCSVSRYIRSLCDKKFWFRKFRQMFINVDLGSSDVIDYRKLYRDLWNWSNDDILVFSAKKGYLPLVKLVTQRNPNVHYSDDIALILAAKNGHLPVVKFLVEHVLEREGPENVAHMIHVNSYDVFKESARHGDLRLVEFLVEHGADIYFNNEAMQLAALNGHLDVIEFLVKHVNEDEGPEVANRMIHSDDDFMVRWAAEKGHLPVISFLVWNVLKQEGPDVVAQMIHAQNDFALRRASLNGHLGVVEFLIDNGASIRAEDDRALRCAAEKGRLDVVKFLVERGANMSAVKKPSAAVRSIFNKHKRSVSETVKESSRCTATTNRGTQCKNKGLPGEKYCRIHRH